MRVVILGTGTAVGKTSISLDLVRGLQSPERPILSLKPIETGFPSQDAEGPTPGSDAALFEAETFHVQHPRPHPRYAFADGISPHLAAERSGESVSLVECAAWVSRAEAAAATGRPLLTLIETAGGVFSPLTLAARNFDLALELGASTWLLVAQDRLGVLHDVAATHAAMQARGRAADLLVLVSPLVPDAATGSNAAELRRLHPELSVVCHEPRLASPHGTELIKWVAARAER